MIKQALTRIEVHDSQGKPADLYIGATNVRAIYKTGKEVDEAELTYIQRKYWHEIRAAIRGYYARHTPGIELLRELK